MSQPHLTEHTPTPDDCDSPAADQLLDWRGMQMTITDGQGGILQLDLSQPGLDELSSACDALLSGKLPSGAFLMRVWAGEETYLLRRVKHAPSSIGITRLGAQTQEVSLAEDVLRLVTGVIAQTRSLRDPATDHNTRPRSDD